MSETCASSTDDVAQLLDAFFAAPGNLISLSEITADGPRRELVPWIECLRNGEPSVLPRAFHRDAKTRVLWYGIAQSHSSLRRLTEDVLGFIGPSYSTFRGGSVRADETDPVEAALAAFAKSRTRGGILRFTAMGEGADKERNRELFSKLERMRRVWSLRPARTLLPPRPVETLLRDFALALEAGRRVAAEAALDELRRRSLLDPLNLSFLRVRLLGRLGSTAEVLDDPLLPDILNTRRPPAVTNAIAAAVYRRYLAAYELSETVNAAITAAGQTVLPLYRSLFGQGSGVCDSDAVKAFALHDAALVVQDRDVHAFHRLVRWPEQSIPAKDAEYVRTIVTYVSTIRESLQRSVVVRIEPGLDSAVDAMRNADFETAFALAHASLSEDPLRRATLLCEAAFELDTLSARSAAVEAVAALPDDTRTTLLKRRAAREVVASLRNDYSASATPDVLEPVPAQLPRNWVEWLEDAQMGRSSISTLRVVARNGAEEWTVGDFLADPNAPQAFVEAIRGQMPTEGESILREQLPIITGFFSRDAAFPRRELASVYHVLFEWGGLLTQGGVDEMAALVEALTGMLSLGMADDEYASAIGLLTELVGRYDAPRMLPWMLDLLEVLILHPACSAGQRSLRLQIVSQVGSIFAGHDQAGRVTATQRKLLRALYEEADAADAFPLRDFHEDTYAADEEPFQGLLSGRVLGIYTLNDKSAQRASQVIMEAVPDCRVILNHDKVCTSGLRSMARTSDIIVIVAGRAKHAATDCISQHVRARGDTQLLYAAGNGATGILSAIEQATPA